MSLFGPPNIAKLKGKRDIAGLIRALDYEKDQYVAAAAAEALGVLRDPAAVEPLISIVGARRGFHGGAIVALGQIGDPRAVECLIGVLEAPAKHPNVAAIEALGRIGDPRAVEPIGRFLGASQGQGGPVEVAAGNALCAIGGYRALDLLIRAQKTVEVERFGTSAVEPLIAALGWTSSDYRFGDLALLKSWVCRVLEEIGDPRAVEPLCGLLQNASAFVPEWAAVALRERAAVALGRIGDPRAVDPLVAALGDAEPAVRAAAVQSLGRFHGGADAAEPLIATLGDPDRGVSSAACRAVPCDPRAVAPLVALLDPRGGVLDGTAEGAARKREDR